MIFLYVRMENVFWVSPQLPNFYPKLRRILKYKTKKFCSIVIGETKILFCSTNCDMEFISMMPISGQNCYMNIIIYRV